MEKKPSPEKRDGIWGSLLQGRGTSSARMWPKPSETPPFCLLLSVAVSSFPLTAAGGKEAKAALSQFSVCGTVAQDKRDEQISVSNTWDDNFRPHKLFTSRSTQAHLQKTEYYKILILMLSLERASLEHGTRHEWPSICPGIQQSH